MHGHFDPRAIAEEHWEKRLQEFKNPDFCLFKDEFGIELPDDLRRLYLHREKLTATGIQLESLWVEHFSPLNRLSIEAAKNDYRGRFIQFAVGGEGQALLYCIEMPSMVWMDEGSGRDVEMLPVELKKVMLEIDNALTS